MEKLNDKKRREIYLMLKKCETNLHTPYISRNPYEIEYQELAAMKFRLAYAAVIAHQMGYGSWINDIELPDLTSSFTLFSDLEENIDVSDECLEACWNLWGAFEITHSYYLQALCDHSGWKLRFIEPTYYDLERLTDKEIILCKSLIMNLTNYAENFEEYPAEIGKKEFDALRCRFRKLGVDKESPSYVFDEDYALSVLYLYNPFLDEVEQKCEEVRQWKGKPEYEEICTYMFNDYPLINRYFGDLEQRSLSSFLIVLTGVNASDTEEYSSLFFLNPEVVIMMLLAEMAAKDLLEKIDEERGTENAG